MATTTSDPLGVTRDGHVQTVSPRTVARVTGLLYLLVFVTAGFSEGYVRGTLVVPGDAAATAANIAASEWLFRLGFVSDLVAFSADAVIAVLLYVLLRPAGRTLALVAASLRLVAHPAIASINLLNQFVALQLLSGAAYLTAFDPEQLHALALLFLTAHRYGYLIGGVFFGFHLLALGYLLFRSDRFPGVLGLLIALAAVGYLTESFTFFLLPAYGSFASTLVVVTAVVGELVLALYLVLKGVRSPTATSEAA
ncbi:DUF4386 domain-containing protein [Salinigranum rubrum]|uniref:DUF4386 domain-containing protein n=1 Tax=Salinigranum rubrum TaxID=755307 RepID=A0A2I8VES4_9EURY|nr:DUF4386 domain-containing protein [Salinigranum rubrum]AUV80427.1 DUF4386 domain-containing protein [Salinigranum rubrum]